MLHEQIVRTINKVERVPREIKGVLKNVEVIKNFFPSAFLGSIQSLNASIHA